MGKTFREGVDELKRVVGSGTLEGSIAVDQIYAHFQDSGHGPHGTPAFAFNHPRGGQAGYLSGPIRYRRGEVIQRWANSLLRGRIVAETIDILHSFGDDVALNAPREFDILRNSASLKLLDSGAPIFDLPALVPRLSDAELKAIRKSSPTGPSVTMRWMRRSR